MSRLSRTFQDLKRRREKALILFMTGGDPSLAKNMSLLPALEREGVDVIELGIPFSDPLADGPVIQEASNRALGRGMTLHKLLEAVRRARPHCRLPIVLMGYYNPIYRYGDERFVKEAVQAGVDGVIVPDLPLEESTAFSKTCRKGGLDLIYLVAPTSPDARKRKIARASRGFLYYVSLTGVTGARRELPAELVGDLRRLKQSTKTPVCAGFGISEPEQAKKVAAAADGVIIGSSFVRFLHAHSALQPAEIARRFVRPFAKALGKKTNA